MNKTNPVLVVYYSLTGNTERVAKELAGRLDADLERVHEKRGRHGLLGRMMAAADAWRRVPSAIETPQRDPGDYQVVLIGTPVWVGQMTPAIRAYLKSESRRFRTVGFFVTSGSTPVEAVAPSMQALTHAPAPAVMGLNAVELEGSTLYDTKIAAFVQQIRRSVMQGDEAGDKVALPPSCKRAELAADIAGE